MNLKEKFYKTNKKSRYIFYIYNVITLVVLLFAHIVYFVKEFDYIAIMLTEAAATLLSVGVWGAVFFEVLSKRLKKD